MSVHPRGHTISKEQASCASCFGSGGTTPLVSCSVLSFQHKFMSAPDTYLVELYPCYNRFAHKDVAAFRLDLLNDQLHTGKLVV